MRNLISRLFGEERGQGLIEYALILFVVVIGVIVVLGPIGTRLKQIFEQIRDALQGTSTP